MCSRRGCDGTPIFERKFGDELPLEICQEHYDIAVNGIQEFINNSYDEQEDGCWIWNRARQQQGYGIIGTRGITTKGPRGGTVTAHTMSLFLSEDTDLTLVEMAQIHHLCGERSCVNPEHLVEVTELVHQILHNLGNTRTMHAVLDHITEVYPYAGDSVEQLRQNILAVP